MNNNSLLILFVLSLVLISVFSPFAVLSLLMLTLLIAGAVWFAWGLLKALTQHHDPFEPTDPAESNHS